MEECRVERERRDVSGFSRVELGGTGALNVELGSEERLSIEADPEIMGRVTSEVRDGVLRLGLAKGSWLRSLKCDGIVFDVTMKDISGLTLSGAGTINARKLAAGRLELKVSGTGRVSIDELEASELDVILSGECKCQIEGRCESQEVTLSGAGTYDARKLASYRAKIVLSGAGDVLVNASDTLDAAISGAGDVVCYGEATVFRRVTGAGRITCVREGEDAPCNGQEKEGGS
ncbi:MAG: hypothetical protein GF400_10735 [Candidatus Eisenbacteria bacterium]|nr:hypothetical protein [Candidatus Eisenbacteria bacterium]